jgi:putative DNA methylase
MTITRKKLIEVALPLDAINVASAREKSIRHGHPSTLHLWWARRPLAAARAVIFAQMVDDPSAHPEQFPTPEAQEIERLRLFKIIEQLVLWENTTNEDVLNQARAEIWKSWRATCADNQDHPRAAELFNPDKLPAFHDPFAGGGALPLEAQRLGLEAYASDLNPVAVLINKAMIEIPPKFANRPPVNPESRRGEVGNREREVGNRREGDDALQGVDRVAEGDDGGARDISSGTDVAEGRNLRDEISDHTRSDLDSGEHSGGLGQGIDAGEGAVPGHRPGFTGRRRDTTYPLRTSGLVPRTGNEDTSLSLGRSGQDVDDDATETERVGGGNREEEIESRQTRSLLPISYRLFPKTYRGAQGLAEDVRYYGQWMRDEAEKRIGHLYPKVEVTAEMAADRPDLKPYVGKKLTVIAWLWARTVKSPNPAFAHVDVPLASTFMLSTKAGKEAYVQPVIEGDCYRFTVKVGKPKNAEATQAGTKLGRGSNFKCLLSGTPISGDYIKEEGQAGRMAARLMAIVAEGERGRVYLSPTADMEAIAQKAKPDWKPSGDVPVRLTGGTCVPYGLKEWGDLFTPRQLVALTTFADLVGEAREQLIQDAIAAGLPDDGRGLEGGGKGACAYADAVTVYLAFSIDKAADYWSTICTWHSSKELIRNTFGRQAIPMTWDYVETNIFSDSSGNVSSGIEWAQKVIIMFPSETRGVAIQAKAQQQDISRDRIVSTDPPYYDNIGYADLSDYFYVWLRRSLKSAFPELFATLAVPKAEELVATPYRHGSKLMAEAFFLHGMTQAMCRLSQQAHSAFPVTIYYAFKQAETESSGTSSTGWETFLDAVIQAGFGISGTWPMRTELGNRMVGSGTNALASSIIIVCRARPTNAPTATRREFLMALKSELPLSLTHLQRGNIAPVDLAQAAIGPGMAIYTRYAQVLDAAGKPVSVREALTLINQTLDEVLAEQEGDFDGDTRWALSWFEQFGFNEGPFGDAETLSKAKNTAINGLEQAGIIVTRQGKVRLLRPSELPADWTPDNDKRLTVWETVHQLVRILESGGESGAAVLMAQLGSRADTARELAYHLYTVCERRKRAQEALAYNSLVQSWPEIARLAREGGGSGQIQQPTLL